MIARKIAAVLVGFAIAAIADAAWAQSDTDPSNPPRKTLLERLDNFGKAIFDGILPPSKKKAAQGDSSAAREPSMADGTDLDPNDSPRAGSVLAGTGRRSAAAANTTGNASDPTSGDPPAAHLWDGTRTPARQPAPQASLPGETDSPTVPSLEDTSGLPDSNPADAGKPATRPLHERLAAFRQSVFGPDAGKQPQPQPSLEPGRPTKSRPADGTYRPADGTYRPADGTYRPADGTYGRALEPAAGDTTGRAVVAQRVTPDPRAGGSVPAELPIETAANAPNTPPAPGQAEAAPPADKIPDAAKPESRDGVLAARKGPVLSVETIGPRTISVGRESTYEVGIANSGDVPAEGLVVFVSLPDWAEVAGAGASAGSAEMAGAPAGGSPPGTIQWKVGNLNAKARERLTLKIVPRQSRSFDLAVHWAYKPPASQASIEVQEPKLLLQLEGPREVLYGKKQLYHLKLANTGTGNAENVVLTLLPIGTGANVPASHRAGLLPAGQQKTLEVELTARQTGNLTIQVEARAEGGAHAELAEKVLVRRAGLKVTIDGPRAQFVGAAATYAVTVRNPGNAAARNIKLSLSFPAGARYLSGVEGAHQDAAGGRLEWTLETLAPEVEQSFVVKCTMGQAGTGQIRLEATADDDLVTSAEMPVRVQSVASLSMDVKDPPGPVPVGEEATYEIHVTNRGTREAQGVEVFAYFSHGIEPTAADGAPNRLGPGQVLFQAIPSLAPGAEVVLKVRAKAEVAGNHVFRAEAHCKPLGARLIREATNLYYGDTPAAQEAVQEAARDTTSDEHARAK